MEVSYLSNGDILLTQMRYIEEIIGEMGMESCKPKATPMAAGTAIEFCPDEGPGLQDEFTHTAFRAGTGKKQFLASQTRPDIAFATNYLARFNIRPNKQCWSALKDETRYLQGSKKLGILFRRELANPDNLRPLAYSDADWAGADPKSKSTTGYIIFVNGAPVSWRSQRQGGVSKSTTESEYIAASEAACKLIWLNDLMTDAGWIEQGPARVACKLKEDNQGSIAIAKGEAVPKHSRHIQIRYHLIRDLVEKEEIELQHVSSSENAADGLTKPLGKEEFREFIKKLGLRSL